LADLVTCSDEAWANGFGHMIARHHVDFVLCDFRTTDVLAAIELEDRSHAKASRRRRGEFVDDALSAAGIPLVRMQASAWYNASEVTSKIAVALGDKLAIESHGSRGLYRWKKDD